MNRIIENYSSNRNILLLFILVVLFNMGFTLAFAGVEGTLLDLKLWYSASEARELISSYGPEGRTAYIKGTLALDYFYPIVYALLLAFILYRLSAWLILTKLPFAILLFDYLENTAILILLYRYPREGEYLASAAGWFTLLKWVFVALSAILILIFLFKKIARLIAKQ